MNTVGYTYPEAALKLGTTVNTIRKAVTMGNLHPIKVPGERSKYISVEEIESYQGKSLLAISRPIGSDIQQEENISTETAGDEKLRLLAQYIENVYSGIAAKVAAEAGKSLKYLIDVNYSKYSESEKLLEVYLQEVASTGGTSEDKIIKFIDDLAASTAKDLHTDNRLSEELKTSAQTLMKNEIQRQKRLQLA